MDYKRTLNLPQTEFPMKGNLAQKEPEILKFWEEIDIYKLVNEATKDGSFFILHDGPPYANGNIHIGTAFMKILKDIVVKYKTLRGFFSPYIPGWDCHGLPIEHEVVKKLGDKATKISKAELRKKCRDYALHFVNRQSEQFQRLGVRGDWENPYLTLEHYYEATNIKVFRGFFKKGLIYIGHKPILWCPYCQTALAEAEIEYEDEKSPSIYVKFPLKSDFKPLEKFSEKKFVVIWTTTPWTLPANVAITLHPDFEYGAVKVDNEIYVMALGRLEQAASEMGIKDYQVLKKFKGSELKGLVCEHVLMDWDSIIITDEEMVTMEQGTGCVHTAPGHGEEDYLVGLKYKLLMPMPVDDSGVFTSEAGKYRNLFIEKANPVIIRDLERKGLLHDAGEITHAYPHCWRCKNPVIFRATRQWFISIDKNNFRGKLLDIIPGVRWIPDWSINRIGSMIEERPDWCISRQRSWGVPIPAFYCEKCGELLLNEKILESVEQFFMREGADGWFIKEAREILPPDTVCLKCKGTKFIKETNILDVWFESGVSHEAVLKNKKELRWPADLYIEGSDQHRGWFQTSLLTSVGIHAKAPYRIVITHGFTVDEEGRKMSKSLGNVVDPLEIIKKSGADILRLWSVSTDYTHDIRVSEEIIKRNIEAYRKLRNTFRFLMGNIADFNPKKDKVNYQNLEEIDRWALHKLYRLVEEVRRAYDDYEFYTAYHLVYNFCVVEMSAFYLDVLKDRIYTFGRSSKERRSAQAVLYEILLTLLKITSPILTFTTEEAWQLLKKMTEVELSVQLAGWPELDKKFYQPDLERKWDQILAIRNEVTKVLEVARNEKLIGNSLEAKMEIFAEGTTFKLLKDNQEMLATLFIVSAVGLKMGLSEIPARSYFSDEYKLAINVVRAPGEKCERCWNYSESVGKDSEYPEICARCVKVVEKYFKE